MHEDDAIYYTAQYQYKPKMTHEDMQIAFICKYVLPAISVIVGAYYVLQHLTEAGTR